MTEVESYKPKKSSFASQPDSRGYFDVTDYDENEDGYLVTITQYRKYSIPIGLSPAAYERYQAREHVLGVHTTLPPPGQDYFASVELRRQINAEATSVGLTQIACKYCSGPHLTQDCPVKEILTKETKEQNKMYLCKFEPIPIGFQPRDMEKLIEDEFGKINPLIEELNKLNRERELTKEEAEQRTYYANVLKGLPPKINIREDRFIPGKRPGERIDTGITGYEICFATFKTREAADFAERRFQRVELVGQNTFMYCMFLREVDA